jgi:hypothetical protein
MKGKPRSHRLVIDVRLNEGVEQQECIEWLQIMLDQWMDNLGAPSRTGRLRNGRLAAITVRPPGS